MRKLDAVIEAADIQPGDRVLEIGCGWGAFAIRAVQKTGCTVTGACDTHTHTHTHVHTHFCDTRCAEDRLHSHRYGPWVHIRTHTHTHTHTRTHYFAIRAVCYGLPSACACVVMLVLASANSVQTFIRVRMPVGPMCVCVCVTQVSPSARSSFTRPTHV